MIFFFLSSLTQSSTGLIQLTQSRHKKTELMNEIGTLSLSMICDNQKNNFNLLRDSSLSTLNEKLIFFQNLSRVNIFRDRRVYYLSNER